MSGAAADNRLLLGELRWLVRLRWAAGAGVLLFGIAQLMFLDWLDHPMQTIALGCGILSYNALLVASMRPWAARPVSRRTVHALALAQILFDLMALTVLSVSSGGLSSPVAAFFVFHMVFASVLLPRALAMTCAAVAVAFFGSGLLLTGQMPADGPGLLLAGGWVATVIVTLYLAERLATALYQRERSRLHLYRRGRRMAAHLEQQQKAMMQHEKMVAMGQLAAGVAHEINNPLASIDSLLQLIARRPEIVERPGTLDSMREQVQRIQTIVRRLTAFAHPDAGRLEEADLVESVRATLRVLSLDHRLREVEVEQDLGNAPVVARVVVRSFQQVLTNLVINALDALADTKHPRLTLRVRRDGDNCLVEVGDNGPGISPEHLERIFEPFFTTKPVGRGTGLGLSISRSLVREQGGELLVRSAVGEGAIFTVRLRGSASPVGTGAAVSSAIAPSSHV